jgi:hypothetical protein
MLQFIAKRPRQYLAREVLRIASNSADACYDQEATSDARAIQSCEHDELEKVVACRLIAASTVMFALLLRVDDLVDGAD